MNCEANSTYLKSHFIEELPSFVNKAKLKPKLIGFTFKNKK